uniref:MFS domain-containing protein n=1 Tax=Steinernema glaseri TaxID=37863 RepID=A0A1I7YYK4_9BILA
MSSSRRVAEESSLMFSDCVFRRAKRAEPVLLIHPVQFTATESVTARKLARRFPNVLLDPTPGLASMAFFRRRLSGMRSLRVTMGLFRLEPRGLTLTRSFALKGVRTSSFTKTVHRKASTSAPGLQNIQMGFEDNQTRMLGQRKQTFSELFAKQTMTKISPLGITPEKKKAIVDYDGASSTASITSRNSKIFPSTRFFMAVLLCLCFISLSISTSNLSVSMVCMIRKSQNMSATELKDEVTRIRRSLSNTSFVQAEMLLDVLDEIETSNGTVVGNGSRPVTRCSLARLHKRAIELSAYSESEHDDDTTRHQQEESVQIESCEGKLDWSPTDQGIVFAAQNAGSLLMFFTGLQADRLNGKWTIVVALILLIVSNVLIPLLAWHSVWLVVLARVLTGVADSFLSPSTSSMITRWFPPKERPFAIGFITGGRQIGTLLILPVAGFLCGRPDFFHGWPSIFYLSAGIGAIILIIWLFMSADKPSKHFCISGIERDFVEKKIEEEKMGKRNEKRVVPWKQIFTSRPFYVAVGALICHEYPLVIMLQLLPKYLNDVLKFGNLTNGVLSALPIGVLFISKTLSSSLSSLIGSRKKGRFVVSRTTLAKIFNGVASLGLGICTGIVPLLNTEDQRVAAIVVLCLANMFAGLHTPGVQTALVQLAPGFSGIITGISFSVVAVAGIINKVLSNRIVETGSIQEWTIVFEIAAVVALLPVFFFSVWGSADRQPWATPKSKSIQSHVASISAFPDSLTLRPDHKDYAIASGLKFTLFMGQEKKAPE